MNPVKIGQNHPLCKTLQKKGFSIRLSRDIVTEVFSSIKKSLTDKEDVSLPIGDFIVLPETRTKQRRMGLNGPEWVYSKKYNVKFKPK